MADDAPQKRAVAIALLPDLPGIVHGIKSLDPCTVQCDGCGKTHTDKRVALAVILSGILFNPRARDDMRRMCSGCWEAAGWAQGMSGWKRIEVKRNG